MLNDENIHCGYVTLIGRPNVGKSTLLNQLLGQKISITSNKPQTTRHRLLGIKTINNHQIIYVDTPGIHLRQSHAMNRYLNQTATSSMEGVDLVVWLVEALRWTEEDDFVFQSVIKTPLPTILAINKVDKVKDKTTLLPYLQQVSTKQVFADIIPLSARQGDNLAALETKIIELLPLNSPLFPTSQITDRSERFLVSEIVREKLTRRLDAELPYRLTVQIEHFSSEAHLTHISAVIWVETEGQKAIVIGKKGQVLKKIGEIARQEIEILLENKVFLQLWVKVKTGWSNNEQLLQQLGYSET
jgi:GTP-binding protein Era